MNASKNTNKKYLHSMKNSHLLGPSLTLVVLSSYLLSFSFYYFPYTPSSITLQLPYCKFYNRCH